MKILFVTHKYPPTIGGMEKQSYELVTSTAKAHNVIVHAYEGQGSKAKWFLTLKKALKKILQQHPDIDIIHLNDGLMAAATLWLKKYTSIPVMATIHGLDITFPSAIFQKRIVPKLYKLDGIICVSHATAQACLARGFAPEKVHVVLNGVDHDLAQIPKQADFLARVKNDTGVDLRNKKIIMTMGRAVKRKGFSWFLNEIVPHLDDKAVFLMIGPLNTKPSRSEKLINTLPSNLRSKIQLMLGMATDVQAITTALSDPKTKDKVYHMGKVSFTDLMQYLAVADLFVMPNIKVPGDAEGFGLVALEASLRGTPVIAAGIEGITDAVRDGKNGILLPSGAAQQWIDTLNGLINAPERIAYMSAKAASNTLADYGWDLMVEGYLEVFGRSSKS